MITSSGLHIGYGHSLLTVEDLNLDAGVYILIGKNGSGKSTFLKTLTGSIQPVSGSILLNGTPVHSINPSDRPKHIAFVKTQFPVVDFLRVSEYLALGRSPYTSFFGKLTAKDKELVHSAMANLNIEHLGNRFTNELSDGERQMVAIARTFAQETTVIALDEPTAFLDYKNKAEIINKLIELSKNHNKCVVLSSHDIDQSISSGADFLVVEQENQTIKHYPSGVEKNILLDKAF